MSETEDPVITISRLLKTKIRVVKDDGALANINVSSDWNDRELLKDCEAQITIGLAEATDQKIELAGKTRRRLCLLKLGVWATDQPGTGESGRIMRNKTVEEINRVVRENRAKPNETTYDFINTGPNTQTSKAYHGKSENSPYASSWTELTSLEYQKLWYSDDDHNQITYTENGAYAVMLFRFKTESREKTAKKIVLTFEGYGTAPSGNGATIKVWNHVASAWQNAQTGSPSQEDETITITLTSNLTEYIDDGGYMWFLARTTNPSDGTTPAVLYCDYVCCRVTVNGITYCDIVSYRNADRVDVKPFIFRTEFILKSWFFENIGA